MDPLAKSFEFYADEVKRDWGDSQKHFVVERGKTVELYLEWDINELQGLFYKSMEEVRIEVCSSHLK